MKIGDKVILTNEYAKFLCKRHRMYMTEFPLALKNNMSGLEDLIQVAKEKTVGSIVYVGEFILKADFLVNGVITQYILKYEGVVPVEGNNF